MFFNIWPFLIVERKSYLVPNSIVKKNAQLRRFVFVYKFKLLPSVYNNSRAPIHSTSEIFFKVLFHIALMQTTQLGKKTNNSLFGYKRHNTVLLTILVGDVICNVFNS